MKQVQTTLKHWEGETKWEKSNEYDRFISDVEKMDIKKIIEENKMKTNKILKIIVIIILSMTILSISFLAILFGRQNIGKITFMNSEAKLNYKYLVSDFINLKKAAAFPEHDEYYLFGEQYNNDFYLAYAGEILEKDTLLYGEKRVNPNAYWAIKINDGVIISSWISYSPLSEIQLVPYSFDEQKKQVKIFEKNRGNRIIGYYSVEE